jgi:hypothetical protein
MSSLVPCIQCRRHVQRGESACPFCGAAPSAPVLGRQLPVPKDAKRATLFAIGVSLVSACEGMADNTVPIYGAPAPPMSQGGNAGAGGAGPGGNAGVGPVGGSPGAGGNVGNPQPVYGAPVPPAQGGNAGTEGIPPDAGDGSEDAGDASPF